MRRGIEIIPVVGIPEVRPGDVLTDLITAGVTLLDGDVLVVTQKVVSKAEGRLVAIDPDDMAARRALVERESVRVLRRRGDLIISETTHGFVCANAGVDFSNVEAGYAALLPVDADRSARRIRDGVRAAVEKRRQRTVAVSPIVAGAAIRGPADRLLVELGHESSVVGVARLYAPLASTLVVDEADARLADAVEAEGMRCVVAPTVMYGATEAEALARVCLQASAAT